MTRSIPVQRRAKGTRDKLTRAALNVIQREGRDGFTTAQIATEAGVSIGTLYRYYSDRVDVLNDLYPDRVEGLRPNRPIKPESLTRGEINAVLEYVRAHTVVASR